MNWNNFKTKFHSSWHSSLKKFIESDECDKIYTFLKNQKGVEIAPKSAYTFRPFLQPLKELSVVVLFEEPYSEKIDDRQYADGIALSCEYVDKVHPQLNTFYNAMEKEFYGLKLTMIKESNLNFFIKQGAFFLNSSLTVEVGNPGSHKDLWVPFNKYLIENVFKKRKIPIVFCGEGVYQQYKDCVNIKDYYFIISQPISETVIGIPWNTENVFTRTNLYLNRLTKKEEIMWVNMDCPY